MNVNSQAGLSGDGVRVAMPLFQEEGGGSIPTSPLQFTIYKISLSRARKLNRQWHSRLPEYNTGFLNYAKVCFGAQFKGIFYGVAIWSHPLARALPQKTWLELRRLAISPDSPKNTASRMVAIMTQLIKKDFPHIETLISYQDTRVHKGIIYKASGWSPGQHSKGGTWSSPTSIDPNTGRARLRPDLQNATGPKIRWEKRIRNNHNVKAQSK